MGTADVAASERVREETSDGASTSGAAPGQAASVGFWRTNRGIAIGILVLIVALAASIWFSDWAHEEVRDGFTLGGFPLFAVAMMALSVLIMIFDGQATRSTDEVRAFRFLHLLIVLGATAVVGLCFLAIPLIGFVPAITVLVLVGTVGLGFRPLWVAVLVALGTGLALRLLLYALAMNVADGPLATLFAGGAHV